MNTLRKIALAFCLWAILTMAADALAGSGRFLHFFAGNSGGSGGAWNLLLQENGDPLLQENGDPIRLE